MNRVYHDLKGFVCLFVDISPPLPAAPACLLTRRNKDRQNKYTSTICKKCITDSISRESPVNDNQHERSHLKRCQNSIPYFFVVSFIYTHHISKHSSMDAGCSTNEAQLAWGRRAGCGPGQGRCQELVISGYSISFAASDLEDPFRKMKSESYQCLSALHFHFICRVPTSERSCHHAYVLSYYPDTYQHCKNQNLSLARAFQGTGHPEVRKPPLKLTMLT